MKKNLLLLLVAFSLVIFNSCEKSNSDELGQIPGMGNTDGELQIKSPFVMPNGINIIGEVTGVKIPGTKSGELKPAIDSKSAYECYGSGRYVRLKITLLNTKNYPLTVFFPKGLMWQCNFGNFQHALQIQTSWVCLQANSSRTIVVDLYCVNLGIPSPDETGTYKILGVTSSKVMWNLLNLIGWKRVNYEMYNFSKGTKSGPTYDEITEKLQTIVWNLTNNGIDITEQDKEFINSIPELADEEIPVVDENSKYPEYFDEFKAPEK